MNAEVDLLIQPYCLESDRSLLHLLVAELAKPDWEHFRAAVAFARSSGNFRELLQVLAAFADRGGIVDMTFGADTFAGANSGSDLEAIRALLASLDAKPTSSIYLYHEEGRTFHPKLYMFSNLDTKRALVIIGSSNWSGGGMADNIELNVVLRLNLADADSMQCYTNLVTCVDTFLEGKMKGQGFACRVTIENLQDFAPLLRAKDRAGAETEGAANGGGAPATAPDLAAAKKLFGGTPFKARLPFTRPKSSAPARPRPKKARKPGGAGGKRRPTRKQGKPLPVLVTEIPKSDVRWGQANFTRGSFEGFFGMSAGKTRVATLQHVHTDGALGAIEKRPGVWVKSRNFRLELAAASGLAYPTKGRPIAVFVRTAAWTFKYMLLMPGDPHHATISKYLDTVWTGRSDRMRCIEIHTTALQDVWPGCPL